MQGAGKEVQKDSSEYSICFVCLLFTLFTLIILLLSDVFIFRNNNYTFNRINGNIITLSKVNYLATTLNCLRLNKMLREILVHSSQSILAIFKVFSFNSSSHIGSKKLNHNKKYVLNS